MFTSSFAKVLLGLFGTLCSVPVRAETLPAHAHCIAPPPQIYLFVQAGVRIDYYPLLSDSIDQLPREMALHGPLDDSAIRRDALLAWDIYWHWSVIQQDTPEGVTITKAARLVVPVWCPAAAPATSPERMEWERYQLAVLEHEAGHAIRYLEASQPLESIMRTHLQFCQDCSLREANTLGYSILARLNLSQLQYDRETTHGLSQAARLTPPR